MTNAHYLRDFGIVNCDLLLGINKNGRIFGQFYRLPIFSLLNYLVRSLHFALHWDGYIIYIRHRLPILRLLFISFFRNLRLRL